MKTRNQFLNAPAMSIFATLLIALVETLFIVHASALVNAVPTGNLTINLAADESHERPGRWTDAASMSTVRTRFTMTELHDGRALVAGGRTSHFSRIATEVCEIYLPREDAWQPTASMAIQRENHTATLLRDGRVLVVGGRRFEGSASITEASAEIYDPRTGLWALTGPMAGARYQHAAALLPNGRVLVAGGFAFGHELDTAEVYDPRTGSWTPAASMSEVRQAPTATELEDGRVLLVGGFNSCCSIATAEIYNPRTGAWSPAGAMRVPRGSHDAALLGDGRVLIAGGLVADETVFESTASSEVYNPQSNRWHRVADMSQSRIDPGLTVLRNGHVLVSGGFQTPDFASIAHAEILDSRSEDWTPTVPMNLACGGHQTQLLHNGSVLVVGGDPNEEVPTATAEVFRRGNGHRN